MLDKKKIIPLFIMVSMIVICTMINVHANAYTYVDESFEDGVLPEYFTTRIAGKGNVKIQTDEKSGEKAVKVVSEAKNDSLNGFSVPFESVKNGVLMVEFKMRVENRTALFNALTVTGEGGTIIDYVDLKGTLYYYYGTWQSNTVTSLTNEYKTFKYAIDMDKKKVDIYVNDKLIISQSGFRSADTMSATTLNFYNSYSDMRYGAGGAWLPTGEGDAIFWVDDIRVWQDGLIIEGCSHKENAEIDVDENIKITFNENINDSNVYDYVEISANDEKVNADKYVVLAENKEITIFFKEGFDYNTSYSLKILKGMSAKDKNYLPLKEDFVLNFKTNRLFDKVDGLEDNSIYSTFSVVLPQKEGVEITASLKKPDGSDVEYISGTVIEEIGKYTLTISGVNGTNGKTQTEIYNFEVVGEQPPSANNLLVKVKDNEKLLKNSTLYADWNYRDINGDGEGEHKYQWYVSDKKDAGFEAIEGANSQEYVLSEKDINKYIKVSVIPVSVKEEGEECFSEVFTGFFLPRASDVTVTGEIGIGKELEVSYRYWDENGEAESGTEIFWYRSTDNGETWVKIEGGNGLKYAVGESDFDCIIRVGIVPGKAVAKGEEVYSESLTGMMKPDAKNVKIVGTAKVGQSIYVSYVFEDGNGDAEGKTKIEWYVDGKMISTEKSLTLTTEMKGKKIYAKVIPVSENYPYEGDGVESDRTSISATVTKGGGGGGGSAISITPAKPEKEEETKPEQDNKIEEENTIVFSDIENHWAKETIIEMYEKGVVKGVSEKLFSPDAPITRAQFATMILNLIGDDEEAEDIRFSDVEDSDWFCDAVIKVASKGYMNGFEGKFRPNEYITREEICVVIKNVINAEETDISVLKIFKDESDISDWAKESVAFAFEKSIVNGKEDDNFCPKDNATRAEGLVMLKRMVDSQEVAR